MKVAAILVAAGSGVRMGSAVKKQYLPLNGKPVLAHTLEVFEQCRAIDEILVAVPPGEEDFFVKEIVAPWGFSKIKAVVAGGKTRQESVLRCLHALDETVAYVLIHDGVRPFLSLDSLYSICNEVVMRKACIFAVPVKDTMKQVNADQTISHTVPRDFLWAAQTPQAFARPLLLSAYHQAEALGIAATDDSSLVEAAGYPVYILEGSNTNIKITTKEDLDQGEILLKKQHK